MAGKRRAQGQHARPGPIAQEPPLVPAGLRWPAAVAAAGCIGGTVVLGARVRHHAADDGLDRAIDPWLHHTIGMHRAVLGLVAALGEPVPLTLMAAALIVTCLLARRWRGAALVAIAVPAAAALGEKVLKPLVARRLGTGTGSFPSGHAVGMFALATAACLLLAGSRGRLPRVARALLALGAVVVAILVPLAMVGLNHHYFTDAVGGAAVGIAVVVVTAFILDAATRRRPRQPARADAPAGRWPEPVR